MTREIPRQFRAADSVSGVNVSEAPIVGLREQRQMGETVGPNSGGGTHPNNALLFNAATLANVNTWINATW
jgi:hypothetical protein